jgi:ribosomal protein S27AE
MLLQSAFQVPPRRVVASEDLSRPKCPRCDTVVFIAEESRFNAKGHIDHLWSCDDCGNAFVTTIWLWRR